MGEFVLCAASSELERGHKFSVETLLAKKTQRGQKLASMQLQIVNFRDCVHV